MAHLVKSCVLCGSHDIALRWTSERCVIVRCHACSRVVHIEFDPADAPSVRGRIDVVFDPNDPDARDDSA